MLARISTPVVFAWQGLGLLVFGDKPSLRSCVLPRQVGRVARAFGCCVGVGPSRPLRAFRSSSHKTFRNFVPQGIRSSFLKALESIIGA
jgi:hypothetical protein